MTLFWQIFIMCRGNCKGFLFHAEHNCTQRIDGIRDL